jgi:hypothetical protein
MAPLLQLSAFLLHRVMEASADHLAFEQILGINLALKSLTDAGLHRWCSLWRNVALKPDVCTSNCASALEMVKGGAM